MARREPSWLKANTEAAIRWSFRVSRRVPVAVSHRAAVLSQERARRSPSRLNRAHQTLRKVSRRAREGVGGLFLGAGGSVRAPTASSRQEMDPQSIPCFSMATSLTWESYPLRLFPSTPTEDGSEREAPADVGAGAAEV